MQGSKTARRQSTGSRRITPSRKTSRSTITAARAPWGSRCRVGYTARIISRTSQANTITPAWAWPAPATALSTILSCSCRDAAEQLVGRRFARMWGSVALGSVVILLPLAAVGEGIDPGGAIEREDPVQVIDLVLQQLRHPTLALQGVRFPLQVRVLDRDAIRPRDSHQQPGEREAVVPQFEILGADVGDFGVHHRDALA